MPLKIIVVPCLTDNYAYILHDTLSKKTTLVDAPDFAPIKEYLDKEKWGLDSILITHHHDDHIYGVAELVEHYDPLVYGAAADRKRLPNLDISLSDKDKFSVCNLIFKCIDVSGHTLGHLAFYCASENIVFTGDSLMTLGCGRIFEGTPQQMLNSLNQLKRLPNNTIVYSGHEYAAQNARFALSVDLNNSDLKSRAKQIMRNIELKIPNVGFSLEEEMQTNPFLRSNAVEIRASLGLNNNSDLEVFTKLRTMKDNF